MTRQQINIWRVMTWAGILTLTVAFWLSVGYLVLELIDYYGKQF